MPSQAPCEQGCLCVKPNPSEERWADLLLSPALIARFLLPTGGLMPGPCFPGAITAAPSSLLSSLVPRRNLQAFSEMQREGHARPLFSDRKGSPDDSQPPSLRNSPNAECPSTSSANPETPGVPGFLLWDVGLEGIQRLYR